MKFIVLRYIVSTHYTQKLATASNYSQLRVFHINCGVYFYSFEQNIKMLRRNANLSVLLLGHISVCKVLRSRLLMRCFSSITQRASTLFWLELKCGRLAISLLLIRVTTARRWTTFALIEETISTLLTTTTTAISLRESDSPLKSVLLCMQFFCNWSTWSNFDFCVEKFGKSVYTNFLCGCDCSSCNTDIQFQLFCVDVCNIRIIFEIIIIIIIIIAASLYAGTWRSYALWPNHTSLSPTATQVLQRNSPLFAKRKNMPALEANTSLRPSRSKP